MGCHEGTSKAKCGYCVEASSGTQLLVSGNLYFIYE